MSNDFVTIRVDDRRVLQLLDEIERKGKDMSVPMAAISEIMRTSVDTNFEKQGRYKDPESFLGGGKHWDDIKQETKMARLNRYKGNRTGTGKISARGNRFLATMKILIDRGILRNSISADSNQNSASVSTGSAAGAYAATQHYGFGNIPARPYMHIMQEDLNQIILILESYLVD